MSTIGSVCLTIAAPADILTVTASSITLAGVFPRVTATVTAPTITLVAPKEDCL